MRLARPLQPRWSGGSARKVTWLELFFDLVFVAAVAQVATHLRDDYSAAGLLRFATLFVLIWWAWIGHTSFSTRFDSDDIVQRALTLLQMFIVAVMAANATEALASRSSAGFAAAYAVMRLVLVLQYVRARTVPRARGLALRHAGGHGVAAALWLASAFVPVPARYAVWALALAIDLGTPWIAVRHAAEVPPDAEHLPERFGLFTLILLGESVVAIMHGIEHHQHWSVNAASAAFLGMTMAFLVWWWYFDVAAGSVAQHVRSRGDALRFNVWSYAHLPLSVAIVTAFVGVERAISADQTTLVATADAAILAGSVAVLMLALTAITSSGRAHRRAPGSGVWPHGVLAGATLLVGSAGSRLLPVTVIVLLTALCLTQIVVATMPASKPRGLDPEAA